jgi:hypothetical protein
MSYESWDSKLLTLCWHRQEEDAGAKRRNKQKRSRYIDDMAAEDRDAEEEDEEEHEVPCCAGCG